MDAATLSADGAHRVQAQTRLPNFIGGRFVDGGAPFDVRNPATGDVHAVAYEADAAMVDAAVAAARECVEGEWGHMPLARRRALLMKVADGIERRFDEFLEAEIADTGKPRAMAAHLDIPRGAANFRVFADFIASLPDEAFEMDTPDGGRAINYSVRKPLGVVGVIAPWNLPLLLMTWKVAPAMACGNAVIVKPSEETPSTTTLLAEVMNEVGVPAGAFNVLHGFGPNSTGERLTSHPGLRAITFTGETRTGAAIMRSAASTTKALSFELGGKNPAIVFADCDFDAAVAGLARAAFLNTGQVCLAPERIYVERPIFERFVAAMKERAEALRPGLPHDESTDLGPLISHEHREKVLGYYSLAIEEGAKLVTGGGVPDLTGAAAGGYFVEPTIWTGLPQTARVTREEIFGPCCHIAPFDSEEEAICLANDTDYGLASSVWTRELSRAHRVGRAMAVGISWVNCWFLRDLRTAFGGARQSGFGREGGAHSIAFYSEITNICVKV
ncbi:2-hydroxymuconic semialdehyde dehydrogenase [Sphingomonas sp. CGMCC 1.13654]|uniref:2-hydroxymuconic semialdehyde dehydrogenase n=1 Tax=Sphingomonas chungangi TaxID=2683589 RepID=A0A838L7N0_9SPHN|nr:2-hydroxymuconic semialdehyde dehydrogenase [Sphingomonas chungangi]MBA2933558.1 2-hydroxymuconic semialdehyde dehydrogenase [Sphingomonas chungangi]MVW54891.1 2-hydroxymuconic semialdehyde dehydrogenase [Sphingomonas chungangi]